MSDTSPDRAPARCLCGAEMYNAPGIGLFCTRTGIDAPCEPGDRTSAVAALAQDAAQQPDWELIRRNLRALAEDIASRRENFGFDNYVALIADALRQAAENGRAEAAAALTVCQQEKERLRKERDAR